MRGRWILDAFVEHAHRRLEEDFLASHRLYTPPWRERLADSRLSPEYGPTSEAAYERELEMHVTSTAGGGLWDTEVAIQMDPKLQAAEVKRGVERYDAERVHRYVRLHSAEVAMRELEVYFAFYRDGLSRGQAARHIGISRQQVTECLGRLRRRARAMRSRAGSTAGE